MATPDIDATPNDGPGPVPEDNVPGHRPAHQQDKPERPPPRPDRSRRPRERSAAPEPEPETETEPDTESDTGGEPPRRRFPFAVAPRFGPASRIFWVDPGTALVEVDEHRLTVRFGRWSLSTPLANVAHASVTGPYAWWKVAGPPRLSLADGGITFATNAARGVCVTFHEPVPGLLPTSAVRHPTATVTVAEPEELVAALAAGAARARQVPVV